MIKKLNFVDGDVIFASVLQQIIGNNWSKCLYNSAYYLILYVNDECFVKLIQSWLGSLTWYTLFIQRNTRPVECKPWDEHFVEVADAILNFYTQNCLCFSELLLCYAINWSKIVCHYGMKCIVTENNRYSWEKDQIRYFFFGEKILQTWLSLVGYINEMVKRRGSYHVYRD